ncbi:hypothetical protein BJY01DRAFT_250346 [Aspergillus pseudoustus]|uniref:Uncharacterized protein n=1 Tax=Aspergillus pseudoustus TaxID=1810923 RepID=A0ABR4JI78_9EURO
MQILTILMLLTSALLQGSLGVFIHLQQINNCSPATYFGATISGDILINWCSSNPTSTIPGIYCGFSENTGVGDDYQRGDAAANTTTTMDGQTVRGCTAEVFGYEIAYPKEGGILVIEASRVEALREQLAGKGENDQARVNKFTELAQRATLARANFPPL